MKYSACPVCASTALQPSITFTAPVFCNVLYATRDEAVAATQGKFEGVYCERCGHFFNAIFDERLLEYNEDYDTSLHFSSSFQSYAEALSDRLVSAYDIRNKHVIEIGCGRGDFLKLVCEGNGNHGYGFDTSYDDRQAENAEFLQFYKEYYSQSHRDIPADLVVCRHVLEHLSNPIEFLSELRKISSWNERTVVYFEVPNGMYSFKELGIWDFIYEHFSYFNASSLRYAFETAGFDVLNLSEGFGGQYLCIEARPSSTSKSVDSANIKLDESVAYSLANIAREYESKVATWNARLDEIVDHGTAIWGAGSKGVSFVNLVKNGRRVDCLVDVNPSKQNRYVPGVGCAVVSPEELSSREVQNVIVMNPNYESEIQRSLRDLSSNARVVVA